MLSGEIDLSKRLHDWSLEAGRSLQSKQTGYLHYHYGESERPFDTIPLVENALFALTLLNCRTIQQVQEAKVLLNGLLAFQVTMGVESHGNFPAYLHEYPNCADHAAAIHLLAPFYWTLAGFGNVIGADLKTKLEQAARVALDYAAKEHCRNPYPYFLAVRLASASCAFGKLWGESDREEAGKKELDQLAAKQLEGWRSPAHLGHLMIGLQKAYPSLAGTPWEPLWEFMNRTWHQPTGSFIGPGLFERQDRQEPELTIYDLFACTFAGQFPKRAAEIRPVHLYGSLVQSWQEQFNSDLGSDSLEGKRGDGNWKTFLSKDFGYTLFEKPTLSQSPIERMFTPFKLVWGDLQYAHSFVCQGGQYQTAHFIDGENSVQLVFDMMCKPSEEDRPQKKRVIEFFLDHHPTVRMTVESKAATTFRLGQKIQLESGNQVLAIRFDLLEGEGDFIGHFMRGNRPSQIHAKGEERFQKYDWTVFLREVRSQSDCRIKASISWSVRR
jgi:hypothetical protein